jgi:hypothetical protein
MKKLLLIAVLLCSCSPQKAPEPTKFTFKANGVSVNQQEGLVTVAYQYPECVLPAATTKEVVVEAKTATPNRSVVSPILNLLGSIVDLVVEIIS